MRVFLVMFLFLLASCGESTSKKQQVRDSVGPSVVRIFGKTKSGHASGGTGFAVYTENMRSYILTNKHICELKDDTNHVIVQFPNKHRVYKRRVIEISSTHDLCLVESLPTFKKGLYIAAELNKGDDIFIVGHPKLYALTVSEGQYIEPTAIFVNGMSKKGKPIIVTNEKRNLVSLLMRPIHSSRLHAYSRGGNSGSPVVNKYGEVVSVLFAGNSGDVMDSYGVPLKFIKHFLKGY